MWLGLPVSHVHPHGWWSRCDVELPVSQAVDIAHSHHHQSNDASDGQGGDEPRGKAKTKTVLIEEHGVDSDCGPRRELTAVNCDKERW